MTFRIYWTFYSINVSDDMSCIVLEVQYIVAKLRIANYYTFLPFLVQ